MRDALLAEAAAAVAVIDVAALEKLVRQLQALGRSVGAPVDDVHVERRRAGPLPPPNPDPPAARRWTSVQQPAVFHRRRDHAPLRYPWGDEPVPRPRPSSDVLPGKPEQLLSAACRERLLAYRRAIAARDEAESELRQRSGRAGYNGPGDPPEWYWSDDPE